MSTAQIYHTLHLKGFLDYPSALLGAQNVFVWYRQRYSTLDVRVVINVHVKLQVSVIVISSCGRLLHTCSFFASFLLTFIYLFDILRASLEKKTLSLKIVDQLIHIVRTYCLFITNFLIVLKIN